MIWGSSSRGSFHTANAPDEQRRADQKRRQFGGNPRLRDASRGTQVPGRTHCRTSTLRAILQPRRKRQHDLFTRVQAGQNFHRIPGAPSGGDQPGMRRAVLDYKHRLQLAAIHQGGRRDRHHLFHAQREDGPPEHAGAQLRHRGKIELHDVGARWRSLPTGRFRKRAHSACGPRFDHGFHRLAHTHRGEFRFVHRCFQPV